MKTCLSSTIVLAMFVVLSSCEPPVPIIEPGSYLPVYPGSYWKYTSTNGTDTVTTVQFIEPYVIDEDADGNRYRVPIYQGKKLWKYTFHLSAHAGTGYVTPSFSTFLKDDVPVATVWASGYVNPSGASGLKIGAKDTTIVIGSTSYYPTIVVEYWMYPTSGTPFKYEAHYYTQNVGLIREESYSGGIVSGTTDLYEYHIHHY